MQMHPLDGRTVLPAPQGRTYVAHTTRVLFPRVIAIGVPDLEGEVGLCTAKLRDTLYVPCPCGQVLWKTVKVIRNEES